MKWLTAEQDGFTQAEIVDPSGVCAAQRPVEIGGVPAGNDVESQAESFLKRGGKRGQFRHVPGVRDGTAAAGEIRADACESNVREAKRLPHGVLEVAWHDTFTEIPKLDHEHDSVCPPRLPRC